ncbi:MAG: AAA-like domain-containing protein [Limisphaerales bacterium]
MKASGTQASPATPAPDTSFFVTGGTVPTDAPSYIERAADRELLEALFEGRLCYVLTSRQMGKSSLMARTKLRLQERRVNALTLDLSAIGQNLTAQQWYAGLLAGVGRELRLEDELDAFWDEHREFGPCQRFFAALTEAALPALAERSPHTPTGAPQLVVFVDELDTVRSLPFKSDEFFAAVRELYNRRTADPALRGLTFCLLGVATPSDLIRDQRITPFNVGTRIELHDFTRREAAPLARGLGGPLSVAGQPEQVLERVLHWTGGHPYLTQRLCRAISAYRGRISRTEVDRLCDGLFLTAEARERDDNLAFVRERILRNEGGRVAALVLYREVLRRPGRQRVDELDPAVAQLRLAGIVRADEGRLRVRNRIYEEVFNDAWVRANLPDAEIVRQRRAFWGGVLRAAAVGLLAVALITALLLWALAEKRRSQAALLNSNVDSGVRRMEQGDHHAALPYFVEALRLEGEAAPERLARTRIASVLAAGPQLRHLLTHIGRVEAVAYSADSSRIFSVAGPGTNATYEAAVWDAETGRRVAEVTGTEALDRIHVAADGRHFATVSLVHDLALYSLGGAHEVHRVWATNNVRGAAFVPGTADLVVGRGSRLLRRPASGGELETLEVSDLTVQALGFDSHPDRLRLAVALGGDRSPGDESTSTTLEVLVLDLKTGQRTPLRAGGLTNWIAPPSQQVLLSSFSFSRNGGWLAACGDGMDAAAVWDLAGTNPAPIALPHKNWVRSAIFLPDGTNLLAACGDGGLYQWNVALRKFMPLPVRHRHDLYRAVLNPAGTLAATVSADGTAFVWDLTGADRAFGPMYHGHFVRDAQFSPDGRQLATASLDHTVRVWTPPVHEPVWSDPGWNAGGTGQIRQVQAPPQAGRVITVFTNRLDRTETVQVWALTNSPPPPRLLHTDAAAVTALAVDGPGATVAAAVGHRVMCWNADTGVLLAQWQETGLVGESTRPTTGEAKRVSVTNRVSALGFAPSGDRLAVGFADGGAALRDLRAGAGVVWLDANKYEADRVSCLAFSPDGRWVAFGHQHGGVEIREAASGKIIATPLLRASGHEVSALAFNPRPGSRQLTVGLRNDRYESLLAQVFDFSESGGLTAQPRRLGHWDGVNALAYRDDGARLATASEDGRVVVWHPDTGRRLSAPIILGRYHASRVAFSPGAGDLLFAIWTYGGARVTLAASSQPLLPAFSEAGQIVGGGFLPGAQALWLVDQERGPGVFALPMERRRIAELRALAVLLHPGNDMDLEDDGELGDQRGRINRGGATAEVWETLRRRAALPAPAPEVRARVWR